MIIRLLLSVLCVFVLASVELNASPSFITFETGQTRPLAISPDGARLYALNTPDNHLEIFDIGAEGIYLRESVPVGLAPIAVAARTDSEIWVVNHLSDSISIVDTSISPARVIRTLLVGDEPRDIVFAGSNGDRAFITTAHRGQNNPNDPQLTTAGIGRADVWVFDAGNLGAVMGGSPITIVTLFTDTPRALAVSNDGSTVYAAGFHTGNKTTPLNEGAVCDGGSAASACTPGVGNTSLTAPGGLPGPNQNTNGDVAPEVGLIVKHDGVNWVDELGRNWNDMVRFNLPDNDVFEIDANANPPVETASHSGVGTILFNMAVNPANGKLYVSNTEAMNHVRFEGQRTAGDTTTTVQGKIHQARVTVIDGSTVIPRHLNKHIDYSVRPAPQSVNDKSLSMPLGMAFANAGQTMYLAAYGSSKIGVFDTAELENNTFTPDSADHIELSGGGPGGLVMDAAHNRLYVLTRFNNSITIVDTLSNTEVASIAMHNPEPQTVKDGRRFLYDARFSSSNGESSCGSCHVFADFDSLAWDLGNPSGSVQGNLNPTGPLGDSGADYHPMKGPMATQSLRGLANMGPMQWRGDRSGANSGGDALDEFAAFMAFQGTFESLLGRSSPVSNADMQAFTNFILDITYPPNPIRSLDNTLSTDEQSGKDFFMNAPSTAGILTCNQCHVLDPANGLFGTSGLLSDKAETQDFKIPHLRNMYQKVGMFGMPPSDSIFSGTGTVFQGDQVRATGYSHDGSVDTLLTFHSTALFNFPDTRTREDVVKFMMAFDSNLAPVVGQQVTLTTASTAAEHDRATLLVNQAIAGNGSVVVKGVINGKTQGWHTIPSGLYMPDSIMEQLIADAQLRALLISVDDSLTYTSVPKIFDHRMGVDRDYDNSLDEDDLCPAIPGPHIDTDSDGVGNVCDNCIAFANADQTDLNVNGIGDACEAPKISGIWATGNVMAGETVSLFVFGEYFDMSPGATQVFVNGIQQFIVQVVTPEMLIVRVTVTADMIGGPVNVTTMQGSVDSSTAFGVVPAGLQITGIWPATLTEGVAASVIVFGNDFDLTPGATEVYFNDVRQFIVQLVSPQMLVVRTTPTANMSGQVRVVTPAGSAISISSLAVVP